MISPGFNQKQGTYLVSFKQCTAENVWNRATFTGLALQSPRETTVRFQASATMCLGSLLFDFKWCRLMMFWDNTPVHLQGPWTA